jgi:hypothetical protein
MQGPALQAQTQNLFLICQRSNRFARLQFHIGQYYSFKEVISHYLNSHCHLHIFLVSNLIFILVLFWFNCQFTILVEVLKVFGPRILLIWSFSYNPASRNSGTKKEKGLWIVYMIREVCTVFRTDLCMIELIALIWKWLFTWWCGFHELAWGQHLVSWQLAFNHFWHSVSRHVWTLFGLYWYEQYTINLHLAGAGSLWPCEGTLMSWDISMEPEK